MSKVVALHSHLVAKVTSCFTCPLSFLESMSPFGGDQNWACRGEDMRSIGSERSTDGSPDWCPLKRQPVLVKWNGPKP